MQRVGIREARQNLSQYAKRARQGEVFVITDRGNEVARLVPPATGGSVLDRLIAEGRATPATRSISEVLDLEPLELPGPPMQEILDELREERLP